MLLLLSERAVLVFVKGIRLACGARGRDAERPNPNRHQTCDRRGAFYGGSFNEGSRFSDSKGFGKDVMHAVKPLGVSILGWPGCNSAPATSGPMRLTPRPADSQRRARRGRAGDKPFRHGRVSALLQAHRR